MKPGDLLQQKYWINGLLVVFPVISLLLCFWSPQFVSDSRMHLLLARNLASGFGSCMVEANPADLSKTLLQPVTFWPPGYSLLLLPFTWLPLSGIWLIALSDALAVLFLYRILYLIVVRLFPKKHLQLLLFLFAFVTLGYTPLGTAFSLGTNLWALDLFLAGGYALLRQVKTPDSLKPGPWVALFAFLSFFIRYAFLPSAMVLVSLSLYVSFRNGNRKAILWQTAVLLIAMGLFFSYQRSTGHSLNYISAYHTKTEKAWYPENLERTTALFSNAFLFPVTYGSTNWFAGLNQFIRSQGHLSGKQVAFGWIKFLLIAAWSVAVFWLWVRFYRRGNRTMRFWMLSILLIILAHAALPFYLSLKYPPELFRGVEGVKPWTYVEEVRYFNLSGMLILGVTLVCVLWEEKRWTKLALLLLMAWNVRSFSVRNASLDNDPVKNVEQRNFWVTQSIPESWIPSNAVFYEKPLRERPSNYHYVSVMMADRGVPILKYRDPSLLKTSRDVSVLLAVDHVEYQDGDRQMLQLALANDGRKVGTLSGGYADLYQIVLKPGQTLTLPKP